MPLAADAVVHKCLPAKVVHVRVSLLATYAVVHKYHLAAVLHVRESLRQKCYMLDKNLRQKCCMLEKAYGRSATG